MESWAKGAGPKDLEKSEHEKLLSWTKVAAAINRQSAAMLQIALIDTKNKKDPCSHLHIWGAYKGSVRSMKYFLKVEKVIETKSGIRCLDVNISLFLLIGIFIQYPFKPHQLKSPRWHHSHSPQISWLLTGWQISVSPQLLQSYLRISQSSPTFSQSLHQFCSCTEVFFGWCLPHRTS